MLRKIADVQKEMDEITQANWDLVFKYQATGDPRVMEEFLENVDKVNVLLQEHNQLCKIYENASRV